MMRKLAFIFLFPFFLFSLEKQPWFSDVYEFHFLGSYTYSYFDKVDHAKTQLNSTFKSNVLHFGLDFSPSPEWSIDTDLEFADTTEMDFGFRTVGLQGRYLWMDDIVGDPFSLTTGFNARFVSSRSLKDVSSPYHGNVDFQLNFALGKEFDSYQFWRFRFWGFGEVGIANLGSPWFGGIFVLEGNYDDLHKWALFLNGSHGYGRKTTVDIENFKGYGKIRYKCLDISARYGYRIGVWGTLRFEYTRRLIAKSYPEEVNFFTFSYLLPFSF